MSDFGMAPLGFWVFACLAVVAVGLGAFAAGRARGERGHHTLSAELAHAQAEVREHNTPQAPWRWQTDAQHGLTRWLAPGQLSHQNCSLFEAQGAQDVLLAALRQQRSFSALRLRAPHAVLGSRGWELHGTPRFDAQGRFVGFGGTALPTDEADAAASDMAALVAVLSATPIALWVLQRTDQGLVVQHANAAAQTEWPVGLAGATLTAQPWPQPVWAALVSDTPNTDPAEGWRLVQAAGAPAVLVLSHSTAQPEAPAAASSDAEAFSLTLSHDLRAPIRVVEGFTRIVKEDYGHVLDRVGNDHLDRVLGAAARMSLMIDALLTLARLSSQPLQSQPVNLSLLASYVVDDLKRAAPEREADIDIEQGLLAHGDPTLLRLVLDNLLGNAWKYSARAAKTQISLRTAPAPSGGLAYVVRDNGAGFDMRSAERLFGLFQRLHSASDFAGHGVGLASVRRIVLRHGGQIWAEGEPGKGAAFYFTLQG
jgi:signal transduction histidine kinase